MKHEYPGRIFFLGWKSIDIDCAFQVRAGLGLAKEIRRRAAEATATMNFRMGLYGVNFGGKHGPGLPYRRPKELRVGSGYGATGRHD